MLNIFSRLSQLVEAEKFKQWRVVENEAKMYRRKRRQHLYESIDASNPDPAQEKPFHPRQFADWGTAERSRGAKGSTGGDLASSSGTA
jgi:hypothetical protein